MANRGYITEPPTTNYRAVWVKFWGYPGKITGLPNFFNQYIAKTHPGEVAGKTFTLFVDTF